MKLVLNVIPESCVPVLSDIFRSPAPVCVEATSIHSTREVEETVSTVTLK